MNRTIFFSIVGLGVFSAAALAGSRAQQAGVVTCNGSAQSAPVVLVTQPDGNCVVATCVTVAACDPKAKGQADRKTYTFTTQGGLVGGRAVTTQEGCAEGEGTKPSNLFKRIFESSQSSPSAVAELEIDPVVVEFDDDDGESWRARLEHALAAAHGHFSANQDGMHASWKHAAEKAQAADELARATCDEALEASREALQAAQERSHEAHERALVERQTQAQADRGAQRSKRVNARSEERARGDHDASLEARIEALEEAARGRGQAVDAQRSLEERVAQLEKLTAKGLVGQRSELFGLSRGGPSGNTSELRSIFSRKPKATPPVAPVPPTPPSARSAPPRDAPSAPFMKLRRAEPGMPAAPMPPQMMDEEREKMARAMADLKREAARLRDELARMRAEVERLPRADGAR